MRSCSAPAPCSGRGGSTTSTTAAMPTSSPAMQQATVNLFADMLVQPATLQSGLTTAAASTDTPRRPPLRARPPGSSPPAPRSPSAARPRTPAAAASAESRSRSTAAPRGTRRAGARAGATAGHRPSAARSPSAAALSMTAATWREPSRAAGAASRVAAGHRPRAEPRPERPAERRSCAARAGVAQKGARLAARIGGLARALSAERAAVPRGSRTPPRWRRRGTQEVHGGRRQDPPHLAAPEPLRASPARALASTSRGRGGGSP